MKLIFNYKNKKIKIDVKKLSTLEKVRGLMFRRREKASALLFDFKKPVKISIHSLFVFFPFFAVWLDDKNDVIEIKEIKPWEFSILPSKKFYKLIEIPCNNKYEEIILFLVGESKGLNTK